VERLSRKKWVWEWVCWITSHEFFEGDLLSEHIGIYNSIIMNYIDQYMNTQLNIDKPIWSELDLSTIF